MVILDSRGTHTNGAGHVSRGLAPSACGRFYTTRDDADSDLDSHFFDRFDTKLSKSTVWTAKAMRDDVVQPVSGS